MGSKIRYCGGLLACLIAVLALGGTASAARPGALDASFGSGGRVATSTPSGPPSWNSDALPFTFHFRPDWDPDSTRVDTASNGTFAVARDNAVLRYLPSGLLDRRFGDGGVLSVTSVEGLPLALADVAIDEMDRVWAFGTAVDPSIKRELPGYAPITVSPSFAVVMRFDATGRADPSFGGGDGVFRNGLGLLSPYASMADMPLVEIESAELDSAGRPVLAIGEIGLPPSEGHSYFDWITDTLVRLTPSGELDPGFGDGGIAENLLSRFHSYSDFCVAGEQPVIAYRGSRGGWLTQLRGDGAPDPAFGDGGSLYVRGGSGPLDCEPSGRLTMLQQPGFKRAGGQSFWSVVRVSRDGRIARRFGRRGRAVVRLPGRSALAALAVAPGGEILLTGTLRTPKRGKARARSFFTVIRLLPSGRPDRRFGHRGWLRTGFGRAATITAYDGILDSSGRLLAVGSGRAPWLQPGGPVLARYLLR